MNLQVPLLSALLNKGRSVEPLAKLSGCAAREPRNLRTHHFLRRTEIQARRTSTSSASADFESPNPPPAPPPINSSKKNSPAQLRTLAKSRSLGAPTRSIHDRWNLQNSGAGSASGSGRAGALKKTQEEC